MKKKIFFVASAVIAGLCVITSSYLVKTEFLAGGSGIKPPV